MVEVRSAGGRKRLQIEDTMRVGVMYLPDLVSVPLQKEGEEYAALAR